MLEIFFSVKAETQQGDQIRIVGSPPELGEWDPLRAMQLNKKHGFWQCGPVERQLEEKFEFKIIKINKNNQVIWQSLPQNSNRKFKPRQSTKLILEWNNYEGQTQIFSPGKSNKSKKGTQKSFDSASSPTIKRKFNPYLTAGDQISSSSQEEEQQFNFQKEDQNELSACDNEFQEIYYRSNSFEIFSGLTKKVKVFVISSKIDLQNPFHNSVLNSMKSLPRSYHIKWITMQALSGRRKSFCTSQLTVSTFFQIEDQQIHFKSLQSSYFVLIDLESALIFSQKVKNKNFGIFLPSKDYEACLKALSSLGSEAKWILFDDNLANQNLLGYLINNPTQEMETDHLKQIYLNGPRAEHLIETVVHYDISNDIIVTPNSILSESEAFPIFTEDNSITILEGGLVDHYNEFVQELLLKKKEKSIIIIICKENHLHSFVQALRKVYNVVIIYDNFRSVIFDNQEYQPLKRLQEILQLFRMKINLYKDSIGGQIFEKNSSISYILPKDKEESIAEKILNDYKLISSKYSFLKVFKKGRKIKVSWTLAEEARTIRTICEIKYSNFGPLGNFNIISDCLSLRQLKDDLKLITQHYQKLFKHGERTQIRYYSYGGRKRSPTCYVTPKCSDD